MAGKALLHYTVDALCYVDADVRCRYMLDVDASGRCQMRRSDHGCSRQITISISYVWW